MNHAVEVLLEPLEQDHVVANIFFCRFYVSDLRHQVAIVLERVRFQLLELGPHGRAQSLGCAWSPAEMVLASESILWISHHAERLALFILCLQSCVLRRWHM